MVLTIIQQVEARREANGICKARVGLEPTTDIEPSPLEDKLCVRLGDPLPHPIPHRIPETMEKTSSEVLGSHSREKGDPPLGGGQCGLDDLQRVVLAWGKLSDPIRRAIGALVEAAER